MKFSKVTNIVKERGYNVSIVNVLFDGIDNVKYGVFDSNAICIYGNKEDEIREIEEIVKKMRYRYAIRIGENFSTHEIFIY